MDQLRGIKLRRYPTPEQARQMDKTIGACRRMYNKMLEIQQKV